MLKNGFVKIERRKNLVVALKNLDCVPTLLLFGKAVDRRFFDVSDSMLNRARERVLRNCFAVFGGVDCGFCRFLNACAFKSRNLDYFAAKLT